MNSRWQPWQKNKKKTTTATSNCNCAKISERQLLGVEIKSEIEKPACYMKSGSKAKPLTPKARALIKFWVWFSFWTEKIREKTRHLRTRSKFVTFEPLNELRIEKKKTKNLTQWQLKTDQIDEMVALHFSFKIQSRLNGNSGLRCREYHSLHRLQQCIWNDIGFSL